MTRGHWPRSLAKVTGQGHWPSDSVAPSWPPLSPGGTGAPPWMRGCAGTAGLSGSAPRPGWHVACSDWTSSSSSGCPSARLGKRPELDSTGSVCYHCAQRHSFTFQSGYCMIFLLLILCVKSKGRLRHLSGAACPVVRASAPPGSQTKEQTRRSSAASVR